MHKSSMLRMKCFVDHYVTGGKGKKILDVGSCNVNGCYKELFSNIDIEYVGLDIEAGSNVDVVAEKLYCWDSLEDESFDYIISGQAFEHIEYPWLTMQEIYKKLKFSGIVCIIAPNGLYEHRFPKDCYRYYADGMSALANWAGFEIIEVSVAGVPSREVLSDWDDIWNDVCLVACKSKAVCNKFIDHIMFPVERRYDPTQNLKLEYDFISKWEIERDKIDRIIIDFVKKGKYDEIYIIGDENIGVSLANLFQSKKIDYKTIKTEEHSVTESISVETGSLIDIHFIEKNILCILTILDSHRTLIKEYKKKQHISTVFYIDDLVEREKILEILNDMRSHFRECKDIYIYGAGENGKRILEILDKYLFSVSGFVVSNDKYSENQSIDKIFKISEISSDSGIIISPNDDKMIKETLERLGFKYYLDGKELLR